MKICSSRNCSAFSVLELLAVMAVVALLSVATIPAFNSIGASNGMAQGLYDVAGMMELARNEAVTRQTYVWVAFENTEVNNQAVLCMEAFYSRDGSTDADEVVPLSRMVRIRNAKLVDWANLKEVTRAEFSDGVPVSVAANDKSVVRTGAGGQSLTRSITFTPRGEALLAGKPDSFDPYDTYIDLGFRQAKGTQVLDNADDAAVIVEGSTGIVRKIRAQ